MLPALLIGACLAALIQTLVPREVLVAVGSNPVLSVFSMLALAFIVSICSNVDAFFALAFRGTFTPGAITSFLTFGPMIDIKMIALMRTTFTTRAILEITAMVFVFSAMIGLLINYAF